MASSPPHRHDVGTSARRRAVAALAAVLATTAALPLVAGAGAPAPGPPTSSIDTTIPSSTISSTTISSTTSPTTTSPTFASATTAPTSTTSVPTTTSIPVVTTTSEVSTSVAPTTAPASGTTPDSGTVAADPGDTTTTAPTSTTPSSTTTTTTTVATIDPPTTTALPAAEAELGVQVFPDQIDQILATIRYLESRGIYTLPPNRGNASGAYQFIESTWNGYGGFQHAYLAPPSVQDERAAIDVQLFLDRFDGDVSMVPVMWYYPAAARDPELMDRVPRPEYGNVLTIREYQARWLTVFASYSGESVIASDDLGVDRTASDGVAPDIARPTEDSVDPPTMSFPVLGPSRMAVPDCDAAESIDASVTSDGDPTRPTRADIDAAGLCAPQAPAVVFGVQLQPVLAVTDGVVTHVHDEPGSGEPITVTITDLAGRSHIHAGFNDDTPGTNDGAAPRHLRLTSLAHVGTVVRAGQVIGFMGDTDPLPINVRESVPTDGSVVIDPDRVAPHVRITVLDILGRPIDAFGPVVDALFDQTCRVLIGQWSVPGDGGDHEPVVIETTDDDDTIDSEWIITSTGQVHASGWAAMVNPGTGCAFTPPNHHGPGAAGSADWLPHWLDPYELPTTTWVATALLDTDTQPTMFVG